MSASKPHAQAPRTVALIEEQATASARSHGPPQPPLEIQSSDSSEASRHPEASEGELDGPPPRLRWQLNLMLFVATVFSVFLAGVWLASATAAEASSLTGFFTLGAAYALPLLAILLCHEFGHFIAARLHGVPTSLPYFIPMPGLNLFGTMGAVILMPGRIRSAKAVLDIGAAGPLAGMVVAIPVMLWGLSLSEVQPQTSVHYIQEGQSILYVALKYLVLGRIPPGFDVELHPMAFAGWTGFFITFINLIPFAQFDGGHVAYALLGRRHHQMARWVLHLPLVIALYNIAIYGGPLLERFSAEGTEHLAFSDFFNVGSTTTWLVFWGLLHLMRRVSGAEHPPVDDPELGAGRRVVAVITLALFVLLFMPVPLVIY